jgi:long-subunit acyl-CoA synthetase (AMP-forming)
MGVMLSHHNLAWTTSVIAVNQRDVVSKDSVLVSYLPLSHIAEQLFSIYLHISVGYKVFYEESGNLLNTMREVKPTVLFGVPRVWEKVRLQ